MGATQLSLLSKRQFSVTEVLILEMILMSASGIKLTGTCKTGASKVGAKNANGVEKQVEVTRILLKQGRGTKQDLRTIKLAGAKIKKLVGRARDTEEVRSEFFKYTVIVLWDS